MGDLIGWAGGIESDNMLLHGYRIKGTEYLAEKERLKLCELYQLEVTRKQREWEKKRKGNKQRTGAEEVEDVQGDLDDFEDAEEDAPLDREEE